MNGARDRLSDDREQSPERRGDGELSFAGGVSVLNPLSLPP